MYKIYEVSDKALNHDIKKYLKLKKKSSYTLSVHLSKGRIEKRAEEVLDNFIEGNLTLKPEQYQLFAKYINIFGCAEKEEYFNLLQQKAGYDVRETLNQDERSWWDKFLSKFSNPEQEGHSWWNKLLSKFAKPEIKYLPAKKLKRITKKYTSYRRKLYHNPLGHPKLSKKTEDMEYDAEKYMQAYINDKIKIKPEDVVAFKNFIKTIEYPLYEGSTGEKALKKLEDEYGEILARAKEQNATILPMKVRAENYIKNKTDQLKEHLTTNQKWYGRAAASIIGIVTVGALWFGLKNNSETKEDVVATNQAKTETKTSQTDAQNTDEKTFQFAFVSEEYRGIQIKDTRSSSRVTKENKKVKKANDNQKKVKFETKAASDIADSASLARINHHNYILKMRLGEGQSIHLKERVNYLIEKKLISLPKDMFAEDFAYAMEMYRAYGVESSLKDVLDNAKKLSKEENQKVIDDIIAVGPTGLGVQKMAAAKNGGKLNNKSVYDRASKKTQKQYNMNMKRWLKLKKQMSRVA